MNPHKIDGLNSHQQDPTSYLLLKYNQPFKAITCTYSVDDASWVEVPDATEDLVEQVGHPLMVQVHVDHLT